MASVNRLGMKANIAGGSSILTATAQMRAALLSPISSKVGLASLYRGSISELTSAALGGSLLFGINNWFRNILGVAENEKRLTFGVLLAAASTGLVDAIVYKPLEFMKVQMQTDSSVTFSTKAISIYKRGGVFLFYRGLTSSIMRDVLGNMGFFSCYHTLKNRYVPTNGNISKTSTVTILLSGAAAGIVYELISFPFETAAVLMQLDQGRIAQHSSSIKCIAAVVEERGMLGLYRGISPTLVRALPAYAASFYAYESVLEHLKDNGK
jgi:solute carrier family 25 (mitochondrial carnitine/acylcarnitine transporter), member 20/29